MVSLDLRNQIQMRTIVFQGLFTLLTIFFLSYGVIWSKCKDDDHKYIKNRDQKERGNFVHLTFFSCLMVELNLNC